MRRVKIFAGAMGVAAVAVGFAVAGVGSAHAGTNGQQVRVCVNGVGADYTKIVVGGGNQDGAPITAVDVLGEDGCASFDGFWWKGDISVNATESASGAFTNAGRICAVPVELEGDWFDCVIDAASAGRFGSPPRRPESPATE